MNQRPLAADRRSRQTWRMRNREGLEAECTMRTNGVIGGVQRKKCLPL